MTGRIKLIIVSLAVLGVGVLLFAHSKRTHSGKPDDGDNLQQTSSMTALADRLRLKGDTAKAYCKRNAFNTDYCFLIDFSLHSGKKRFFVWDLKGDSIKHASLCAHGYGRNSTVNEPVFSNVEGSYCSSLGKYKVGIQSYSKWGIHIHYKLHGLEKTNNNAYKRIVVLHSFDPVPENEIYPMHLPLGMSQGCPVISNETMRQVDALQKSNTKPTLLWVYN